MNKRSAPAIITATLALGATTTAPYYDINITQHLCAPACVDETPVFLPKFTIKSIANVGLSQYIIVVHIEGVVNYIPCNCGSCCTRSQVISQDFTIPVYSANTITAVAVTMGTAQNGIARISCCDCSRTFVSDCPLTLAITTTTA